MLLFMCREYFIKPFVPLNLPRPVTSIFIDAPVAWRCAEARELPGSPLCAAGSCSLVIDTLKSGCWDLTPAPEVRRRCLRRGHVFQNTPLPHVVVAQEAPDPVACDSTVPNTVNGPLTTLGEAGGRDLGAGGAVGRSRADSSQSGPEAGTPFPQGVTLPFVFLS